VSKPLAFSGARAIVRVNGKLVAFATDVSYVVETEYKIQPEIDNFLPAELFPNAVRVQVVMTGVKIPNGSPGVDLFQPTMLNMMSQPYAEIEIRDRATDLTLLDVPRAMMTRRTGRVSTRSLGSETWSFTGIGFWDERAPAATGKTST
jgi:hypothetical protein